MVPRWRAEPAVRGDPVTLAARHQPPDTQGNRVKEGVLRFGIRQPAAVAWRATAAGDGSPGRGVARPEWLRQEETSASLLYPRLFTRLPWPDTGSG